MKTKFQIAKKSFPAPKNLRKKQKKNNLKLKIFILKNFESFFSRASFDAHFPPPSLFSQFQISQLFLFVVSFFVYACVFINGNVLSYFWCCCFFPFNSFFTFFYFLSFCAQFFWFSFGGFFWLVFCCCCFVIIIYVGKSLMNYRGKRHTKVEAPKPSHNLTHDCMNQQPKLRLKRPKIN